MPDIPNTRPVVLIGFGEAGRAFAKGWGKARDHSCRAFDLRHADAALRDAAETLGVDLVDRRDGLFAAAPIVFCLVTADRAQTAAEECAPHLVPGTLWFDCNSAAPDSKRAAAEVIAAAAGDYIDTAVMAPVYPRLHETPLLISGPNAVQSVEVLRQLGMKARCLSGRTGDASSVKMLRSVMVKGMEALSAECFLAARKAGVEAEVLGSLIVSNPEIDWPEQAAYNLERMLVHGMRRAAEMREVTVTLKGLGFDGAMASATADWQDRIGSLGLTAGDARFSDLADRILAAL
jgi:3-hydroxyisobutyrate dehydrogenase-like beta-hydroxyacid dehydrogenase